MNILRGLFRSLPFLCFMPICACTEEVILDMPDGEKRPVVLKADLLARNSDGENPSGWLIIHFCVRIDVVGREDLAVVSFIVYYGGGCGDVELICAVESFSVWYDENL